MICKVCLGFVCVVGFSCDLDFLSVWACCKVCGGFGVWITCLACVLGVGFGDLAGWLLGIWLVG